MAETIGAVKSNSSSTSPSLATFGRRKFLSVASLSEVLKEINQFGMPRVTSRQAIKRARDHEFDKTSSTSYGRVIRPMNIGIDSTGQPVEFWVADPRSNLYFMIRSCDKLESFILRTLQLHPCSPDKPWTIIVYNDEVVAGNPLLRHNHRKAHAYYYSFIEFGISALSSEFLWFTLVVAKSDSVASVNGYGAGMLCKELLLQFAPLATEGFVCGSVILWARVGKLISDEAALKMCLDVKGASGHMICLICRNVISKKAYAVARHSGTDLVVISELDTNKFQRHSDASIVDNAKYLQTQKPLLTAKEFNALETALGLNYAPDGVLLCNNLEFKLSCVSFDYQHVYLVNGIFNFEAGLLLDTLKKEPLRHRVKHTQIHEFVHPFVWPFNQRNGRDVFEKRSTDGGPMSCAASEGLGCFLVLQVFLSLRVFNDARPNVQSACISYYALCTVLVLLTMSARGTVTSDQLMDAMLCHLRLHQVAYGVSRWKPKMHWCLHLPEQLHRWKFLVACFTHERKHKEVKRYMQGRMNPNLSFDKNVLQDVLHMQSLALQEDHPYPSGACLLGPRPASQQLAHWVQSQSMCRSQVMTAVMAKASNYTTVHVNDVVCITWENDTVLVAQVFLLCSVGGALLAGVRCWPKTPQHNMYSTDGPAYLVQMQDIIDVCIYRLDDGNSVAFVVPPRGVAM